MLLFINIVKDELLRYLCFSVFLFGRVCVVLWISNLLYACRDEKKSPKN